MCPGDETVGAYVVGSLGGDARTGFEHHLDTCASCQALVAVLAKGTPADAGSAPTLVAPTLRAEAGAGATTVDGRAGPPVRESLSGKQLGRYLLLAQLGSGGMGVVYAAYDPELDRRVALKVLRHARSGDMLREEARAIARLAHPNVVAVHDVGRVGGETFVAMEHVDGVTVRDWLARKRTVDEIVDVYVQAGRGLAAAHAVGLVHRDIKPSNIMVGADGRARVLDFGIARTADETEGEVAGTPAYMAPEQRVGDRVDARADQYAFCKSLGEALAGQPDVPERITRATRRGLAEDPDERFATVDELLRELAPPPRRTTGWVIATFVMLTAFAGTVAFAAMGEDTGPSCARAGQPVADAWGVPERVALRAAFLGTNAPYGVTAADTTTAALDRWATRWQASADATCRATIIDRRQPAELHALRTSCLDGLLEQLRANLAQATRADKALVSRANAIVTSLPSPERCNDVALMSALPPLPPGEQDRDEIASIRKLIAENEAAILAGRAQEVAPAIRELVKRADALGYGPLRARSHHMLARLESFLGDEAAHAAQLHEAARIAAASRDLQTLAAAWIELSRSLGNDQRTTDQSRIFDGYAASLIEQLPDRIALTVSLALARCERNAPERAGEQVKECQRAIELAEAETPPSRDLAISARIRLGHFLRLAGKADAALETLAIAVSEAERERGPDHPATGLAVHTLGIAQLHANKHAEALAHVRRGLAIRERNTPQGSVQVAESLQGVGDVLSTSGHDLEAIPYFERALAVLDRAKESDSMFAANVHLLLGISLETVKRPADAITHYLRSADISDRSLVHKESHAATALHLAADVEGARGHIATGVTYLERALGLHERGKSSPADRAMTEHRLAVFLVALKPPATQRARALAEAARAGFVVGGDKYKPKLAELDKFLTDHPAR